MTKPLVAIECLVYNHEPYLRECLEGFIIQKTNFPFLVVIHDDKSTDNSVEIIHEYVNKYPNIFIPIYEKENQYSKGDDTLDRIVEDVIYQTKAKYIALCEGDDYWTDPYKLQKQVDYMETHDDCIMCVNATDWDCHGEMREWGCRYDYECDLTTDEVIRNSGLYINTVSTIYRKELSSKKADCKWWQMADVGDYPLHIAGTLYGKCHFFPEVMSVYRYQHEGSWTSQKNHQTTMKHTQCEITWLEEFDKDTDYKYTNAIHYHLWRYYSALYKHNLISLPAYLRSISHSDAKKSVMYKRAIKDIIKRFLNKLK